MNGRTLSLWLGLLVLALGLAAFAAPRARWRDAIPPPQARLPRGPSAVTLRFDRALHSSSYALLWRMEPRPGRVPIRDSLDERDPERRTIALAVVDSLGAGRYRVRWHARVPSLYWLPVGTEGILEFSVGDSAVPMHAARQWAEGSLDPESGGDARTYVVLAGLILIAVSRLVSVRRNADLSGAGRLPT